jgi:hypothetical protein
MNLRRDFFGLFAADRTSKNRRRPSRRHLPLAHETTASGITVEV